MSISVLLDAPFYTGTSVSSDVPSIFPAAIDGHNYILELSKYQRRTLPALRPPQDSSVEPSESSLNTEGYWRRSQTDWSLGAGQEFFDNQDSSRRRFWTSKGADVWTKGALTNLNTTALRASSASTNLKLLPAGVNLYYAAGTALKFVTDGTTFGSPTTVTTTGLSTITGLTTNGSTIYASDGVKLMQGSVGGASLADLGSLTPDYLFWCNGRLIGTDANVLYEIAAAGTSTAIKTHDNTSFVWNYATGASNGIYVSGNAGDRNETYYLGIDTSTGGLAKPYHAMSLPFGETLNCMTPYGGLMLLGTSKGFRVATIDNSTNGLNHGPLIPVTGGVSAIDAQGQYAWITCTNYDSTSTGLIRVNLAEFTEPLVPAYATDLMATTQGTVQSIATFGAKRYLAVSGIGFYGETTTKEPTATVTSGWVRYSTSEQKVVSSLDLRHDSLVGSIAASVTSDSGSTATTSGSSIAASLGPSRPLALGTFTAEMFRVVLTLSRSSTDTTTAPTFRRWTARSIATPFRTEEFIVPIRLERLVQFNGQDYPYSPYDEFLFLKGLEATREVVRYQEGSATYNVYVDGVAIDAPNQWLPDNTFYEGVFLVRLLTVESSA